MEVTLILRTSGIRIEQRTGFNPCYSGSNSKISFERVPSSTIAFVSILVIVEVTLKLQIRSIRLNFLIVSILVIVEVTLKSQSVSA